MPGGALRWCNLFWFRFGGPENLRQAVLGDET